VPVLDVAGAPVKLDLSEGMIHNVRDRMSDAPESALALSTMRDFLHRYLEMRKEHTDGSTGC
jgi:hypothetical protein